MNFLSQVFKNIDLDFMFIPNTELTNSEINPIKINKIKETV